MTVGRSRNAGCVWRRSGQRSRHRPCSSSAVRGVNTDNVLEVAVTDSEGTILDLAWHVVVATDKIVSVFTVVGRSDAVVACLEAELITTNECVPVVHLSFLAARSIGSTVGVNNATKRVALKISTMRVELTALVGPVEADTRVHDETADLDVGRRLYKLQASDGARWNDTCSVTRRGAVSDDLGFYIANRAVGCRRAPKTEITGVVKDQGLAI